MPRPIACRCLFSAILIALAVGCGSSEKRVAVFPVKGSVKFAGKPAVKAQVAFHPSDPAAPRATGEVGEDGTFSLSTYSAGDGAAAGDYEVTIIWPEGSSPIGGDADTNDKLGGVYANPKTSGLKATVTQGPNELKPFLLK